MIYKNLRPVPADIGTLAIHRVIDYPHLKEIITVPIALAELDRVARCFPIVWQDTANGLSLVALTGLESGFNQSMALDNAAGEELFLALKAYPFRAAVHASGDPVVIFHDNAPTDEQAVALPACDAQGRFLPDIMLRLAAARIFAQSESLTQKLSVRLQEADLLRPWDFAIQFDGRALTVKGLQIIDRDIGRRYEKLQPLVREFGRDAIHLCELHELSLFRMNVMAENHASSLARRSQEKQIETDLLVFD